VCVTGHGILRFLHLDASDIKSIGVSMGKRDTPQNYLSHCWIDDRILVGTDNGEILVFENAEFRGALESSPSQDGKSIDSIAAFSKGFVCGCDDGILYIFERDEKKIYRQSKSFQIDNNYVHIRNLAISPSEVHTITLEAVMTATGPAGADGCLVCCCCCCDVVSSLFAGECGVFIGEQSGVRPAVGQHRNSESR
jgi:cilia- and flagella-associated protein 57